MTSLPPIVLVHGFGSSFEHDWRNSGWVDILQGEGREIVGVDLPAHGTNAGIDPSMKSSADVVLDAVGSGPVDAIGFSAGGHAVLSAAARRPEAFRRLAVLGVGAINRAAGAEDAISPVREAVESDGEPTDPNALVLRRLVDASGNDREALLRYISARHPQPSMDEFRKLAVPTLLVIGERDWTGDGTQVVETLVDCNRLVLSKTDHFATLADFRSIDAVVSFLAIST